MSQTVQAQTIRSRLAPALVAGAASFLTLGALLLATMLLQYRSVDFPYLLFALPRIAAISLSVAVLAHLAGRRLRSALAAGLFGVIAGFLGGVAFVVAAA